MTYRIAMHARSPASAVEVDNGMSVHDVVDASEILDTVDAQMKRERE